MAYETQHILDFVMEDDARREGTDVSVEVDTNETVKISFGNLGNVVEGALSEQQRVDPYDNKEYNPNDPRNW